MMTTPSDLKYAKTDEWVKMDGNIATIGITDYAQNQLSDVVFVELTKEIGDLVKKGDSIATIESVKAAAEVNAQVTGKIIEVNNELSDTPEILNDDPFGRGWMYKIEATNIEDLNELMEAAAYDVFCEGRH